MRLFTEVKYLIKREVMQEWRNRYALNGILLYVVATIFICYLSFRKVEPVVWNAVFWIIMVFASINAVAKSFMVESRGRQLYFYTLASAHAVILAKIIYNVALMILLALTCLLFYNIVFHNPVRDGWLYLLGILLGSISFATSLTMVSGIASRAGNNFSLMAILSFPVVIPVLILLIKLSENAIEGASRSASMDELITLLAVNAIVVTVSLLLFPYLWKE